MGRGGARGRGRGRGGGRGRGRGKGRGGRSKKDDESDIVSSDGDEGGTQIKRSRFPKGHKRRKDDSDDDDGPFQPHEQERVREPEAPVAEPPSMYDTLLSTLKSKRPSILDEIGDREDDSEEGEEEENGFDIQEDADALEQGVVLELTAEELEQKRQSMGDDFEIVEVGEDSDDAMDDDVNGEHPADEAHATEVEGAEEGSSEEGSEEEAVALAGLGEDEDDSATRCSEAYTNHFEQDVDGGDPIWAAAVESEKERKKANFSMNGVSVFGAMHVGDSVSPLCKPLKLRKHVPASLVRSRLKVGHVTNGDGVDMLDLTPAQIELFQCLNSYRDVFVPTRTLDNGDELRDAWALHAINHVLAARTRVLRHNTSLRTAAQEGRSDDMEYRDQGFSRPRVLVLLPYRSAAAKLVHTLGRLLLGSDDAKSMKSIRNYGRFHEEFVEVEEEESKHPNPDYLRIFDGNSDDCFRLGIQVSKTSFNLFSDFYGSDIIVASPLGLRMVVGAEGEKERDFDFLSSVEICLVDQADCILMQNWEHLMHVFEHMSLLPTSPRQTDITRIRPWFLEGWAPFFRQTVLVSEFASAEMNALFNRHCHNLAGRVRVAAVTEGAIVNVIPKIPQTFHRFSSETVGQDSKARLDYFLEKIMPLVSTPLHSHVLVFIPSYFDYVVLRNYFRREKICEYTSKANVSRSRSNFFHGRTRFLLYTQRHYYHFRLRIRGVKHVVFFSPPDYPQFYSEILNTIDMSDTECSCTVLYSRHDQPALERVVGTARAQQLLASEKAIFLFV